MLTCVPLIDPIMIRAYAERGGRVWEKVIRRDENFHKIWTKQNQTKKIYTKTICYPIFFLVPIVLFIFWFIEMLCYS